MINNAVIHDFLERDINIISNPAFLEQFLRSNRELLEIRAFLKEMIEGADDSVPNSIKVKLNEYIQRWSGFHEQIKNYDAKTDAQNHFEQGNAINENILHWYTGITNGYFLERGQPPRLIPDPFLSIYSILKNWKLNVRDINDQINAQLVMAKASVKDTEREHDKFVKFIAGLKETVNQQAQEVGVAKFGNIFLSESNVFSKLSTYWIMGAAVILILTISSVVLLSICIDIGKDDTFKFIQFSVIKILVISGGFYALSVCMKNYRAYKHNQVLNKHRHNALTTFETFTKSTEDQQTKNAILLEATHTIFGNQNTGYNNVESSDNDITSKVIEYIRPSPEKG